jgi:hypothetical protein
MSGFDLVRWILSVRWIFSVRFDCASMDDCWDILCEDRHCDDTEHHHANCQIDPCAEECDPWDLGIDENVENVTEAPLIADTLRTIARADVDDHDLAAANSPRSQSQNTSRSMSRSRSPRRNPMLEPAQVLPALLDPTLRGIEHWATPMWHAVEHHRRLLPENQARVFRVDCPGGGMVTEAWPAKARLPIARAYITHRAHLHIGMCFACSHGNQLHTSPAR